jgi:hypothetical protein
MRIAREELKPVLSRLGLRPSRNSRGVWAGTTVTGQLRLRLQLSKWNRLGSLDGYEFTIELQLDREEPIAYARLFRLLSGEELEEHRQIQNQVIAKLPLDEAELDRLPPEWQADRLVRVTPRLAPYPRGSGPDIWFKYLDENDVHRWMRFISRALPGAVDCLAAMAPRIDGVQLQADRARAMEHGDPFHADDDDVLAADEAMRRIAGDINER